MYAYVCMNFLDSQIMLIVDSMWMDSDGEKKSPINWIMMYPPLV